MFGDLSDDDDEDMGINDRIEEIFKSVKSYQMPTMLSPLKEGQNACESMPNEEASPTVLFPNETIASTDTFTTENLKSSTVQPETDTPSSNVLSPSLPDLLAIEPNCNESFSDFSENADQNASPPFEDTNESANVDFNYSPASPRHEEQISTEEPPVIPINTLWSPNPSNCTAETSDEPTIEAESVMNQIIHNYSPKMRGDAMSATTTSELTAAETYLLASVRNAVESYCIANEWTTSAVSCCVEKMLLLSRRPKHLAMAVLEVIEDSREPISFEFTPPAPALQPSHQKCLVLVKRIAHQIPSFDSYLQYELERSLFTFAQDLAVPAMTNLAQFYIALIDTEQPMDKSKVALFVYKSLYYYTHKAIPLVFTMIMAHPFILPHANAVEFIEDPLVRTIISILTNIIYTTDNDKEKSYKKGDMFLTLKRRYGYFADKSFSIDGAVDYCIECIKTSRLQNVDYALILLAKRQGCEWARKQIVEKHLIPMLYQFVSSNLSTTDEHDERIRVILFTIGSIVKTFPPHDNIESFLSIFVRCLNATERQSIQEAAVLAICQTSRFSMTNVYRQLAKWRPKYKVSTNIRATLHTIVYRKPKGFWFT